jgi:hypothetical protein
VRSVMWSTSSFLTPGVLQHIAIFGSLLWIL